MDPDAHPCTSVSSADMRHVVTLTPATEQSEVPPLRVAKAVTVVPAGEKGQAVG